VSDSIPRRSVTRRAGQNAPTPLLASCAGSRLRKVGVYNRFDRDERKQTITITRHQGRKGPQWPSGFRCAVQGYYHHGMVG
jgi:hypothetical protein